MRTEHVAWFSLLLLCGSAHAAEQPTVREDRSLIAVLTHRGGIAAGLAHDHLIVAARYEMSVEFDEATPTDSTMEFRTSAADLVVDDTEMRRTWHPRFVELGILDRPLGELSDDTREKIRRTMLSERQLGAEAFPTISARIAGITEERTTLGAVVFPYLIALELTVRGTAVTRPLAARYEMTDGTIQVEGVGTYRFSDFGIRPYSAMLGAVRNRDEFHVYVTVRLPGAERPAGARPRRPPPPPVPRREGPGGP